MPKIYGKRKQSPDLEETELYDKLTKLESEIIGELELMNRKKNKTFDCIHCHPQQLQEYNPNKNYYDAFWKESLISQICLSRYKTYREWVQTTQRKLERIQQKKYQEREELIAPIYSKSKRKPPKNKFVCEVCSKSYSDQGSLEIHISIKHGESNQQKQQAGFSLLQAHNQKAQQPGQQENYFSDND